MAKFKTYGLTHIALQVRNIKRTLKFYKEIFDVQVMYGDDNMVQVQMPGANDIIVVEEGKKKRKRYCRYRALRISHGERRRYAARSFDHKKGWRKNKRHGLSLFRESLMFSFMILTATK